MIIVRHFVSITRDWLEGGGDFFESVNVNKPITVGIFPAYFIRSEITFVRTNLYSLRFFLGEKNFNRSVLCEQIWFSYTCKLAAISKYTGKQNQLKNSVVYPILSNKISEFVVNYAVGGRTRSTLLQQISKRKAFTRRNDCSCIICSVLRELYGIRICGSFM